MALGPLSEVASGRNLIGSRIEAPRTVLTIEIELLEAVRVSNAEELQEIDPFQIKRLSLGIRSDDAEETSLYDARAGDLQAAIRELLGLVTRSQPGGTSVRVWYLGRSESFAV
jgi:hypothetical protein